MHLSSFSPSPCLLQLPRSSLYALCQELIQEQEEALQEEREAETKALKEEIQLLLKKEKEAQVSSSDPPKMLHQSHLGV